jgi:hypothetical protein
MASVASGELALRASENKAEGEGSDRRTEEYCMIYGDCGVVRYEAELW